MTPTYLDSKASPFPMEWHENDHSPNSHHEHFMFNSKTQVSSSSSSSPRSIPCTMFSNPNLDQEPYHEEKADTFVLHAGSYDHHPRKENESDKYYMATQKNNEDQSYGNTTVNNDGSTKSWMSSKMRMMRKMRSNDSARTATPNQTYDANPNNIIRACSDCNTTKTPLWRSGPRGPKTLCNACGIRQRKARRAMASAAAAEANNEVLDTPTKTFSYVTPKVQTKIKKKRSKKLVLAPSSTDNSQKLCFEDFTLRLSEKYSSFQRVFPQDEKEAAILLMALSCGLVS